uniref:Plastid lipid-associated protein/fibrillin conserved domain-containing protein n=1 Tax=Tetraselmis sp. GSL018 TaxID=582737 RepID=A0A061RTJ7_9CHLO|mmetsp:Transcript_4972/g.12105  ORF Transcript_4972/g.12105 Transcript_4972/m.12105 type:complete len:297 (+) Transcript_4972:92-982(+)
MKVLERAELPFASPFTGSTPVIRAECGRLRGKAPVCTSRQIPSDHKLRGVTCLANGSEETYARPALSRRQLAFGLVSAAAAACNSASDAFQVKDFGNDYESTRQQLLDCIASGSDYDEVEAAIRRLTPFNPSPQPAQSEILQGNWKLLWSSQTAEVTKATKNLPLPFTSMQLIGPGGGRGEPGGELPQGRAANIIKVLGGAVTLKLSSAADPSSGDPSSVIIGPPFRLELLVGGRSIPLQQEETVGSDTSPVLGSQRNVFTQEYVEGTGRPGDLRISRVTEGDPAVVGSAFVHVRV